MITQLPRYICRNTFVSKCLLLHVCSDATVTIRLFRHTCYRTSVSTYLLLQVCFDIPVVTHLLRHAYYHMSVPARSPQLLCLSHPPLSYYISLIFIHPAVCHTQQHGQASSGEELQWQSLFSVVLINMSQKPSIRNPQKGVAAE